MDNEKKKLAQELIQSFHSLKKIGHMGPSIPHLTPAQMHLLHTLYYRDKKKEGIPVSTLSDMMKITSSATTQTIGGLEEQGLITREMSAKDRRIILVSLTEKGIGMVKYFDKHTQKLLGELIDYLGMDKTREFIDILHGIRDFLKETKNTQERTEGKKC